MIDGDTIRRIREAVAAGRLTEPFRLAEVNYVLNVDFAGVYSFLTTGSAIRVASRSFSLKFSGGRIG